MRARLNRPWVEAVAVLGVYLLALGFGLQPLSDADLGGHIAGGLWILRMHALPTQDPFGAQGNFWLCYSWLAEIPMGLAYEFAGFEGVRLLQVLFCLATAASVVLLTQSLYRRGSKSPASYLAESLTMIVVIPLILPLVRLRPQVISFVLFALLVGLADRDQLKAKYLVPVTLVWASVHVYFLLVSAVVFVHRAMFPREPGLQSRVRGAMLAFGYAVLGLVNPYTWRLYAGVWGYLFEHKAANALISELAPFGIFYYDYSWLYLLVVALGLLSFKTLLQKERPGHILFFVVSAAATVSHFRYLSLFAISALPILRTTLAEWLPRLGGEGSPSAEGIAVADRRPPRWLHSPVTPLIFLPLAFAMVHAQPFLPRPYGELFDVARRLQQDYPAGNGGNINVLTNASEGLWLILAFWVNRPPGAHETRFKVAFDGRTLLMGEKRVREYDDLRQMKPDWPNILRAWNIGVIVLPSQAAILQALTSGQGGPESGHWSVFTRTSLWTVLVRGRRNTDVSDDVAGGASPARRPCGAPSAFPIPFAGELVRVVA